MKQNNVQEKTQEAKAGGWVPGLASLWYKSIDHSGSQVFSFKETKFGG